MYPKGTCLINGKDVIHITVFSEENKSTLAINLSCLSHQEICSNLEMYLGFYVLVFLRRKGKCCGSSNHTSMS